TSFHVSRGRNLFCLLPDGWLSPVFLGFTLELQGIGKKRSTCSWFCPYKERCEAIRIISESLAVMHTAVDNIVAQSLVCTLGKLIIDDRIGGHLNAVVTARPVLRLGEQLPAYSTVAVILGNIPTLDVAYRL